MKKRMILAGIAVAVILLPLFIKTNSAEHHITLTGELGTVSELTVYGNTAAITRAEEYIKKADRLFSITKPESEISRLNSGENILVSKDTAEVLALATQYADKETFNPFAGAIFEVWDISIKKQTLPDINAILKANANSFPISLEFQGNTAKLTNSDQKINLGSIAKGYITDKLKDILNEEKIVSALINLGGNIYAHGKKPNGEPWYIAVRSPENADEYIGVVSVEDTAVVTSGDYERSFILNGERYHHIIDPKTGCPAKSGLRSVTIITPDATIADILSTKCFVLGFEASKPVLEKHHVSAIFVTDDNRVLFSAGLAENFSFDNTHYSYEPF